MSSLTAAQRHAVEHLYGPMLVIAGAGSGKTRVLAERAARLIRDGYAQPHQLLCVTFSEAAAENLRDRIAALVGLQAMAVQACTFHSWCHGFLRREGERFSVVDDMDLKVYLNLHIEDLPLNIFRRAANPGEFIAALLDFNTRCQDDMVSPQDFAAYVERLKQDARLPLPRVAKSKEQLSRDAVLQRCGEISDVYLHVERLLRERGWCTFGEMMLRAVRRLTEDEARRRAEQNKIKYLLVDEFQDSNHAQIELLALLAGKKKNVFAVGDPDQSIYRFRGASGEAFEEFSRRFGAPPVVNLDTNFRSYPPILRCAFAVIDRNPAVALENTAPQRDPLVPSRRTAASEPVTALISRDWGGEARALAEAILERRSQGAAWSDCAVLYRSHFHRDEVVREFTERNIPIDVRGVDASAAADVRDAIAVLRALLVPGDSVSLVRTAALASFALDPQKLREGFSAAARDELPTAILTRVPGGKRVVDTLEATRARVVSVPAVAAVDVVLRDFALPSSTALVAFRKFVADWQGKAICENNTLRAFVEYLDCYLSLNGTIPLFEPPPAEAVVLTTAHGAKGLEFKHVFVLRCNSSSFPGGYKESLLELPRDLSHGTSAVNAKAAHEQEERRLFYVAMTRAADSLTLSARPGVGKDSSPPGFLRELLSDTSLQDVIARRDSAIGFDIAAAAAPLTQVGEWLSLPPRMNGDFSLSASGIESYKRCPMQYKIAQDWRISGEVTAAQQYGNAVHQVLRAYFDAEKAGKRLDEASLLGCFADAIAQANIVDPLQRQLYTAQGRKHLAAFARSRTAVPLAPVLATEKRFAFDVRGVRVHGRIDRLDRISEEEVAIEDYKTGAPRDQEKADESLQLTVYALAAAREGKRATTLSFYNLENNTTVFTRRSERQLREAEEIIVEVAEGIRNGEFDPKPAFHCRTCSYASICPAKEDRLFQIARAVAVH